MEFCEEKKWQRLIAEKAVPTVKQKKNLTVRDA